MSLNLSDKTYVIMGVANKHSIAWGIAQALDQAGATLIFTIMSDRFKKSLTKLTAELEHNKEPMIVNCDVSEDQDVENAFKEIKGKVDGIDGVVHAIAFANKEDIKGRYVDTSRDGFLHSLNISAYSLTKVANESKELMNEGGSIVTLTYLGGERAVPNYNLMGVSKSALESSVRYLAQDLGQDGIRVNAVSAGPIRTLSSKPVGNFSAILSEIEKRAPLKRNIDQIEVGNSVAFLLSDLASGVTGEVLHVDSGYHIVG